MWHLWTVPEMGRDALPLVIENALAIVTEFGKEEERRTLSTRGYNHSFAIVVIEFKFFQLSSWF